MSSTSHNKRKRQSGRDQYGTVMEGDLILTGERALAQDEEGIPLWKHEVVDEKGSKRLHGAFTGGFNAGYFNTVGSKEGWVPANFVSSRKSRFQGSNRRAVDYMDAEDMAGIVDDSELKLMKEERLKEQEECRAEEVDESTTTLSRLESAHEHHATRTTESSVSTRSGVLLPSQGKKTTKILTLVDDDDDEVHGFDIGPKIKYDHTLAKKKKANGATTQHVFQTRKVLRNPQPEPELVTVQAPKESTYFQDRTPANDRLLPSIGAGASADIKPFEGNNSDGLGKSGAESIMQEPIVEAKIPPWRRKETAAAAAIPSIGKQIASLALQSTFTPYANDSQKHERYRHYLEVESGLHDGRHRQGDLEPDLWRAECDEFRKCALMYKPMTGLMSQKFISSLTQGSGTLTDEEQLLPSASPMSVSREVEAARAGNFGHLTRIHMTWTPSKLLCKRFGIVQPVTQLGKSAARGDTTDVRGSELNRIAVEELMGAHAK